MGILICEAIYSDFSHQNFRNFFNLNNHTVLSVSLNVVVKQCVLQSMQCSYSEKIQLRRRSCCNILDICSTFVFVCLISSISNHIQTKKKIIVHNFNLENFVYYKHLFLLSQMLSNFPVIVIKWSVAKKYIWKNFNM